MPEWKLYANESAEQQLRDAANRGTLAHALLLTGSGDLGAAAEFAAAAFLCTAPANRPCGECAACRKVRMQIHPDVITVQDPEHQSIAVELVRSARSDAYIRPNEGARKVYLFPDCAALTERDQNVLLKIVEEGPSYAVFLFCAENPALVLPTLRSRCVELPLRPVEESGSVSEEVTALCRRMGQRKRSAVTEFLLGMDSARTSREDVLSLLSGAYGMFAAALLEEYGLRTDPEVAETAAYLAKSLTKGQIVRTIELLQKYRQDCRYNVNAGQVLGALAAELEGIL